MQKLFLMLLFISILYTGCPSSSTSSLTNSLPSLTPSISGGQGQEVQTTTTIRLSTENYKILKTNIVGTDWGINILGLIPIVSPDYTKAIAKLYKAGEVTEGKPQAIVNILQQHTAPFFILFSIPRITFRADVVEFTKATYTDPLTPQ
jgi:hypothetical protein